MTNLLFIGNLGTGEIVIIALVVLLLFGGKKIPELMRGIGKGVRSFKDGMSDIEKEINEDLIIAVVYGFFGVLAWFYNMPTSEENCEATGYMRQRKAEKKADYKGEKFHE